MKKAIRRLLKVAIFSVFLWNVGLVQLIYKTQRDKPPEIERSSEERAALNSDIKKFWNSKLAAAQAEIRRGDDYSPYDYFRDLTEFALKFKGCSAGAFSQLGLCQSLMNEAIGSGRRYTENDIVAARDKYYLATGQENMTSGQQAKVTGQIMASKMLGWLWAVYLHNLIFALLLFVFWDMERRDKVAVKNPLSIILNAILHPLTISIIVYQYWSTKMMEGEYRRTKKKFLTVLSEDELAFLQTAIRQGLSRREFRLLLEARGSIVRHSLAWGMTAALVLSVAPVKASPVQAVFMAEKEVVQSCAPSGTHFVQTDVGVANHSVDMIVEKIFVLQVFIDVLFIKKIISLFRDEHLVEKIEHVPLAYS